MQIHIYKNGKKKTLNCEQIKEATILGAIQKLGVDFDAPCGGNGKCNRCKVMISDENGVKIVLACKTPIKDEIKVYIEEANPVIVESGGCACSYKTDICNDKYGIAIDVGTTTMVLRIFNLQDGRCLAQTSKTNPQTVFGADVISRINASMDGKLSNMTNCLINTLNEMAKSVCSKIKIAEEEITKRVLVGNTVMESIAASISPDPIGINPFIPLDYFGKDISIPDFGTAYFAKCASGYVGGDITADMISINMQNSDKLILMLDLGTNGEMALGCKEKILTCATAAGPVFEGGNIEYGMPARAGAISKVFFDKDDICCKIISQDNKEDNCDVFGICGTGIMDAVATLLKLEIVDETGRILDIDELPKNISEKIMERITENETGKRFYLLGDIYISQADIRNVQLAKAAIYAGIKTLVIEYGTELDKIDKLLISGGFGSFLDAKTAAEVGLIPKELLSKTKSIGNAAIEGASAMLLSEQARKDAQVIGETCEYIELSTSKTFNNIYVDCMMF